MFKRLIAIFLLVALVSTNFSRFFVYAGFELNHQYIAEHLCVNKARPWMHCNGKCYFMRKMKEVQDNEKKQQQADQQNHYQEGLPVTQAVAEILPAEDAAKTNYPNTSTPGTIERSYSLLLPPKVV